MASSGTVALIVGVLIVGAVATPIGATGTLPPSNPRSNLEPHPNFLSSGVCSVTGTGAPCANPCVSLVGSGISIRPRFPAFSNAPDCTQFVLRAVNTARALEHLSAMVLPSNWYSLTPPEQLFVLADLERTARGLPPYLGLNRALTREAQRAARRQVDPGFAPGFAVGLDRQKVRGMGGTLAMSFTTLEADYTWMYQDGWGGSAYTPNMACSSASAPGCWGHRDQLLGSDGTYNAGVGLRCTKCEMGAGFAIVKGTGTFTDLVELPAGSPPPMYFTWASDVVPYLQH
jgi:hypothetical protein